MDESYDQYRKIRKPMPKPGKVISNKLDMQFDARWDWRSITEDDE